MTTDHSERVCPVIAAYERELSDRMPDDATRTRLLVPYAARMTGTRSTPEVERARMYLLADWAVRSVAPRALDVAGLCGRAEQLRALPPVVDEATARKAAHAANAAHASAANANANATYASAYAAYAAYGANAAAYAAAAYAAAAANNASAEAVWEDAAAMLGRLCEVGGGQ